MARSRRGWLGHADAPAATPAALGWALFVAAATAGCGGGALHQATLVRDCGPADAQCALSGLDAPLAVGANTRPMLVGSMSGSAVPELRMVSAREDRIEASGSMLRAKEPGVSAILLTTPDGTVVDFLHVWAVAANRIELHGMTAAGARFGQLGDALELEVGESFYVEPRPYAGAQPLLGELDAEWSLVPPVAAVYKTGRPGLRRLRAQSPGDSALVVRALGQEARLRLVVHEPLRSASPVADAASRSAAGAANTGTPDETAADAPEVGLIDPWARNKEASP